MRNICPANMMTLSDTHRGLGTLLSHLEIWAETINQIITVIRLLNSFDKKLFVSELSLNSAHYTLSSFLLRSLLSC